MSIDVAHLSFSYGSREILHDLSFSIPDGCLVNVLGPNGVGKSTLFRCILGLSPHYSGTILVNGKDLRALSVRERAREISYIPQSHAPVYDYEVVDVVLMATGNDLKMLATPGKPSCSVPTRRWPASASSTWPIAPTRKSPAASSSSCSSRGHSRKTRAPSSWTSPQARSITATPCACSPACGNSPARALHRAIDPQPRSRLPVFGRHYGAFEGAAAGLRQPHDVITSELISELYDIEVEVNSLMATRCASACPFAR